MSTLEKRIFGRFNTGVDDFAAAGLDPSSEALLAIDYAHSEIHKGSRFFVIYSVADLGAMTTPNDAITLSFKTPNTTKWAHFAFSGVGTAGWLLKLVEGPSGGVESPTGQLSILNHHRNIATTSTLKESTGTTAGVVDYDATLATGGTTLWTEYLGGAGGPFGGAVAGGGRDEIVLKQDTVYQVSLYGTDNNPATLHLDWYEHTDKH